MAVAAARLSSRVSSAPRSCLAWVRAPNAAAQDSVREHSQDTVATCYTLEIGRGLPIPATTVRCARDWPVSCQRLARPGTAPPLYQRPLTSKSLISHMQTPDPTKPAAWPRRGSPQSWPSPIYLGRRWLPSIQSHHTARISVRDAGARPAAHRSFGANGWEFCMHVGGGEHLWIIRSA